MAEMKRWSVTYTKHMKQKRKVYQDGFLELHTSTNKMKLYDDCDKLLECRILKTDEAVSSGETLTFNAFLVDVNDAESRDGDQKTKPAGFNSRENDMKFSEKRAKSWNKSPPFQTPAQNIVRGMKPLQNLSPSQNIIKEFKKRELHKYGAAQSSPETVKTSTTEWQALYTTQLTQKAKKYHDGFLQLAITGSHGKQIILFDSDRNQLNSRFLKKDEVIASGGSIAFDAHLVDIGEQEGDHKPATDLHRRENKRNAVVDLYNENKVAEADMVLDEIQDRGFRPTTLVYEATAAILCRERKVVEIVKVIEKEMVQVNCVPTLKVYSMVVRGLCNEKLPVLAVEFLEKMEKRVGRVADKETCSVLVDGVVVKVDLF